MGHRETYLALAALGLVALSLPAYAATLASKSLPASLTVLASQSTVKSFEQDWADYDNNGKIDILDIAQAAFVWDRPDNYWDLNLNNRTDILDIAVIAFFYDQSLGSPPYPGYGQPPGTMDPSWRQLCTALRQHQAYCEAHV